MSADGSPLVIVPDTTPLIQLASGSALRVLTAMGRVVVPDVVQLEATRFPNKPWASEIAEWVATAGVQVIETGMGRLLRLAIGQGERPPRHAGELSIMEWLHDTLAHGNVSVMVVAEDRRVRRLLAYEGLTEAVPLVATRTLLELAEQKGIIASADSIWWTIEARV